MNWNWQSLPESEEKLNVERIAIEESKKTLPWRLPPWCLGMLLLAYSRNFPLCKYATPMFWPCIGTWHIPCSPSRQPAQPEPSHDSISNNRIGCLHEIPPAKRGQEDVPVVRWNSQSYCPSPIHGFPKIFITGKTKCSNVVIRTCCKHSYNDSLLLATRVRNHTQLAMLV